MSLTEEQLTEWERDAAIGSDTEGLRIAVVPALIAEVRRLKGVEQSREQATLERDGMKATLEKVRALLGCEKRGDHDTD